MKVYKIEISPYYGLLATILLLFYVCIFGVPLSEKLHMDIKKPHYLSIKVYLTVCSVFLYLF